MKTINEHIKNNQYKNVYLICGPEAYLRKQAKDKLKKAVINSDDTMNYSYFEGKNADANEIVGLASTLPFFSDYRVIIMEDTNLFKNAPDHLVNCISEIPSSTILIFVEEEVDKRSRLYKAIQKAGYIATMNSLDEKSLTMWMGTILKKEGKKITNSNVKFFLEKTGMDMDNVKNELEKLCSYTLGREEITSEDIASVTTSITTSKIFDMMTAIANKQQKKALGMYNDLLTLKEPPLRILALLARQFNLLMQVKDLDRLSFSNADTAKKVGLPPFVVGKYKSQAVHFTMEGLKSMIFDCAQTEESVKTGRLSDVIGVELLLIQFSS